jgi:hypothetical protein
VPTRNRRATHAVEINQLNAVRHATINQGQGAASDGQAAEVGSTIASMQVSGAAPPRAIARRSTFRGVHILHHTPPPDTPHRIARAGEGSRTLPEGAQVKVTDIFIPVVQTRLLFRRGTPFRVRMFRRSFFRFSIFNIWNFFPTDAASGSMIGRRIGTVCRMGSSAGALFLMFFRRR